MLKIFHRIFKRRKIKTDTESNVSLFQDSKNILDEIIVLGNSKFINIGKNVSIGTNVRMSANAPINIGDHTMIAINVVFHTSTHNYQNHPMWIERIDKPIKVGKHVWIGFGAIICPGVVIEDYAVIGAGSVVISNVPSKAIVAGNPARIIKFRDLDASILEANVNDYPQGSYVTQGEYNTIAKSCKQKL